MNIAIEGTRRGSWRTLVAVLSVLVFTGCESTKRERPTLMQPATRTELSMRAVPAEGWQGFLSEVVTARFPTGVTVIEANGQWRGQDGKVYGEPSRIVLVVHPSTREANRALEEIRREFKARFGVEVLRTDMPAMVAF